MQAGPDRISVLLTVPPRLCGNASRKASSSLSTRPPGSPEAPRSKTSLCSGNRDGIRAMRLHAHFPANLPRDGLAALLLGAAAVGAPASQQGAYFPPAWGWSAFGLLLAAALRLALRAPLAGRALRWGS